MRTKPARPMKVLERILCLCVLVVTIPLALVWMWIPILLGVFVALPIAAVRYAATGHAGVDWYLDVVFGFFTENWPPFLWLDSIRERDKQ